MHFSYGGAGQEATNRAILARGELDLDTDNKAEGILKKYITFGAVTNKTNADTNKAKHILLGDGSAADPSTSAGPPDVVKTSKMGAGAKEGPLAKMPAKAGVEDDVVEKGDDKFFGDNDSSEEKEDVVKKQGVVKKKKLKKKASSDDDQSSDEGNADESEDGDASEDKKEKKKSAGPRIRNRGRLQANHEPGLLRQSLLGRGRACLSASGRLQTGFRPVSHQCQASARAMPDARSMPQCLLSHA